MLRENDDGDDLSRHLTDASSSQSEKQSVAPTHHFGSDATTTQLFLDDRLDSSLERDEPFDETCCWWKVQIRAYEGDLTGSACSLRFFIFRRSWWIHNRSRISTIVYDSKNRMCVLLVCVALARRDTLSRRGENGVEELLKRSMDWWINPFSSMTSHRPITHHGEYLHPLTTSWASVANKTTTTSIATTITRTREREKAKHKRPRGSPSLSVINS